MTPLVVCALLFFSIVKRGGIKRFVYIWLSSNLFTFGCPPVRSEACDVTLEMGLFLVFTHVTLVLDNRR